MTREEQIGLFIKKSVEGMEDSDTRTAAAITLAAGIHWADRHPHWIPVEEMRPKVSDYYLICDKRGHVRESHYFELDDLWMIYGGALVSPTHWMPLPAAPRKEE